MQPGAGRGDGQGQSGPDTRCLGYPVSGQRVSGAADGWYAPSPGAAATQARAVGTGRPDAPDARDRD